METPIDAELNSGDGSLTITPSSASFLSEMGGWAKFISIVGFVFLGFMVLMGLGIGSVFSMMGSAMPAGTAGFMAIFYVVYAALLFVPCLYLFQFSERIKRAIATRDNNTLERAFEVLKSHYKFVGILTIVGVGFMVLAIGISLVGLAFAAR